MERGNRIVMCHGEWFLFGKKEKERYNIFFFFKQKTAYEIKECDWSSDVCSSDLHLQFFPAHGQSHLLVYAEADHKKQHER